MSGDVTVPIKVAMITEVATSRLKAIIMTKHLNFCTALNAINAGHFAFQAAVYIYLTWGSKKFLLLFEKLQPDSAEIYTATVPFT